MTDFKIHSNDIFREMEIRGTNNFQGIQLLKMTSTTIFLHYKGESETE